MDLSAPAQSRSKRKVAKPSALCASARSGSISTAFSAAALALAYPSTWPPISALLR